MVCTLLVSLLVLSDSPTQAQAPKQAPASAAAPQATAPPSVAEFRFRCPSGFVVFGPEEQVLRQFAATFLNPDRERPDIVENRIGTIRSSPHSPSPTWEWVVKGSPDAIGRLSYTVEQWKLILLQDLGVADSTTDVRTFDLDFPGGSLREYVTRLIAAAGDPNVIVDDAISTFQVPPLSLRGVTLNTTMTHLRELSITDGQGNRVKIGVIESKDAEPRIQNRALYTPGRPIFQIVPSKSASRTPSVPLVYKFDATNKAAADQVETLPQAVMMACAAESIPPSELTFNVHPSGLLMVSGSKQALAVADAVISTALGVPSAADKAARAGAANADDTASTPTPPGNSSQPGTRKPASPRQPGDAR